MTRTECAQWLRAHDRYLILSHSRPDGDTVGSAAALCLGLRKAGKQAYVLENEDITEKYSDLFRNLTISGAEKDMTVVSVDVAAPHMLPKSARELLPRLELRIDHHFSFEAAFTPLSLVDANAAACGEIIHDILIEMGVALDQAIAEALYTAIATDTGCFRFANTTAHTHEVAADCAKTGLDLYPINQRLFDTNAISKLRLQGWIAENTRFFEGGRFAVCALPRAVEQALGVREDDMENLSGFTRSIAGVRMAATLREGADGRVKLSMRSVPGYDSSAVCEAFGGGGHKGASGATIDLPLEQAAQAVAEVMLRVGVPV